MRTRITVAALCALVAALALSLGGSPLSATGSTCDFVTGGGYILPQGSDGGKGTFGVGGGCKLGLYWGHLEYQDHGLGKIVHGTSITGYQMTADNARLICGTGTTPDGVVTFVVRVKDAGEPSSQDEFDIKWQGSGGTYTTFDTGAPHKLVAGSIQLHKPNNSNTGSFGNCPEPSSETFKLSVTLETGGGSGTVTSAPVGIACTLVVPEPPPDPPPPAFQTGSCDAPFAAGSTVTLTALPNLGSDASFSTNCDPVPFSSPRQCTVTMNADITVTVNFSGSE